MARVYVRYGDQVEMLSMLDSEITMDKDTFLNIEDHGSFKSLEES